MALSFGLVAYTTRSTGATDSDIARYYALYKSVADINFMINTKKELSIPLQALLKNKTSVASPDWRSSIQLFLIRTFQSYLGQTAVGRR